MISLSPSKLNVLADCSRCFWDQEVRGVKRPRGPFPSLPGGIDRIVKEYCDAHRKAGTLPNPLVGHVGGKLFPDQMQLNCWRNWRTGLSAQIDIKGEKVVLRGALDDLLFDDASGYSPLDVKTKGQATKDDGRRYYQVQLDCYGLMLERNQRPITGLAYLWYVWPVQVTNDVMYQFDSSVYQLEASAKQAEAVLARAIEVLKGPRPAPAPSCEYCGYAVSYSSA